jgi:hypothetical protein
MADSSNSPPSPALPPELDPRRPVRSPRRSRPGRAPRVSDGSWPAKSARPVSTSDRRWSRAARAVVVLLGLAAVAGVGLGLLVAQLAPAGSKGSKPRTTPGVSTAAAPSKSPAAVPSASAAPAAASPGAALPLAAVTIVDRKGDEGSRPGQAALTHDGDAQTAWTTQRYVTSDFGGLKPGAGLLVDLGRPSAVGAVQVRLTAAGAAVDLRTADDPSIDPATAPVVAATPAAGTDVTLTPPRAAVARYWVVWLTRLPPDGPGFRVGVTEITFTS